MAKTRKKKPEPKPTASGLPEIPDTWFYAGLLAIVIVTLAAIWMKIK